MPVSHTFCAVANMHIFILHYKLNFILHDNYLLMFLCVEQKTAELKAKLRVTGERLQAISRGE